MPITLHIEAADAADLRLQLMQLVGQMHHDFVVPTPPVEREASPPREPLAASVPLVAVRPGPPKKTRQRPPVATPEPIEETIEEATADSFVEDEPIIELPPAKSAESDARALLEAKNKTMPLLQQAFADGKVVQLRKILDTFGQGAKSFPEIEPSQFVEIAKAISNGALNG
jgi:hypothetical protein